MHHEVIGRDGDELIVPFNEKLTITCDAKTKNCTIIIDGKDYSDRTYGVYFSREPNRNPCIELTIDAKFVAAESDAN